MLLCEQQEERWKEADTYTVSTQYWLWDVTYHNLDTYQNWQGLIENRISRHVWLKTYLRWSHKLPNSKLIFKKCRIKVYFDALVYNILSCKVILPFFQSLQGLALHATTKHCRQKSARIAHQNTLTVLCTRFLPQALFYPKLRTRGPKSLPYIITLRKYTLS